MSNRIESLRKDYESKILEADENIKLLLTNPVIIPEHTNINKEIDEQLEKKEKKSKSVFSISINPFFFICL